MELRALASICEFLKKVVSSLQVVLQRFGSAQVDLQVLAGQMFKKLAPGGLSSIHISKIQMRQKVFCLRKLVINPSEYLQITVASGSLKCCIIVTKMASLLVSNSLWVLANLSLKYVLEKLTLGLWQLPQLWFIFFFQAKIHCISFLNSRPENTCSPVVKWLSLWKEIKSKELIDSTF